MFIVPNFVLDRLGKRQEEQYRRGFPDFMDMVIMCADAGLSLEAAVAKVAEEFLVTHKALGIHLSIMMLEVRAGKRLRDALQGFADRIAIEEARSLSTLFKQSEELGASITQTLKVFSTDMRQLRIIRAEEKANALAVKMLLPLGVFMFPVMLLVVVLSPLLSVLQVLSVGAPQ
jgi:tight adherence protein C